VEEALILCRLLHFAAALFLFGASVFQWRLAPPALAAVLSHTLRPTAAAAIVVVFATTVAWLLLAAGEMGEGWSDSLDPQTIAAVLLDTEFGEVWRWRLGLALILLGLLVLGRHDNWPVTALLMAPVVGSLGFIGHAVMITGAVGWLDRASHVLHLLAAGFWLGSLIPLILCFRRPLDEAVSLALNRFSGLGHIAVAIVILTGIVQTWLILGAWPGDITSPYQALLLAKIGCVAVMTGLAIVNRYVLVPRLHDNIGRLRISTIVEIVLGLAAIGLVSVFGTLPPV
jgi:putative copper resistance protein D